VPAKTMLGACEGDALGATDGANAFPGRVRLAMLGASEGSDRGPPRVHVRWAIAKPHRIPRGLP
jgi:hypothetical protein